jgi:hypothetical protein
VPTSAAATRWPAAPARPRRIEQAGGRFQPEQWWRWRIRKLHIDFAIYLRSTCLISSANIFEVATTLPDAILLQ